MKRNPNENYSKPRDIGDPEKREIVYNAVRKLIYDPHSHCRIGDIACYLEDSREEEWDSVKVAHIIFELKKELGWMYKVIDGTLYPVCCPLNNDCKTLALYKPQVTFT